MNNDLLILGAGQYGKVAEEIARALGYEKIGFLDDLYASSPLKADILGPMSLYTQKREEYKNAVVAIGNPKVRMYWLDQLASAGYTIPALVHPRSYVAASAKIGNGAIIEPMALVNVNANILDGCIIAAGAIVNHDAVVGRCCHVDCNAVVAAGTEVAEGTRISCQPAEYTFMEV